MSLSMFTIISKTMILFYGFKSSLIVSICHIQKKTEKYWPSQKKKNCNLGYYSPPPHMALGSSHTPCLIGLKNVRYVGYHTPQSSLDITLIEQSLGSHGRSTRVPVLDPPNDPSQNVCRRSRAAENYFPGNIYSDIFL